MTTPSPDSATAATPDPRAWHAFSLRWAGLHDAASAVGMLAGLAPQQPDPAIRSFPARVRDGAGRRFALVEHGVNDIAAFMQPGLAALLAVTARGQDASAPALALWHEFRAARDAVMALVPASDTIRRSA